MAMHGRKCSFQRIHGGGKGYKNRLVYPAKLYNFIHRNYPTNPVGLSGVGLYRFHCIYGHWTRLCWISWKYKIHKISFIFPRHLQSFLWRKLNLKTRSEYPTLRLRPWLEKFNIHYLLNRRSTHYLKMSSCTKL